MGYPIILYVYLDIKKDYSYLFLKINKIMKTIKLTHIIDNKEQEEILAKLAERYKIING